METSTAQLSHGGYSNGGGTVFKITLGGTLTTLYSFCSQQACADGDYPSAGRFKTLTGTSTAQP